MAGGSYKTSFNDNSTGPEVTITGNTDQTLIGNTSNRLNVAPTIPSIPHDRTVNQPEYMLNSTSNSMSVNGSVTPVTFSYAPASGETWYIQSLECLLIDTGVMSPTNFGALNTLTNGVLITASINGVVYTICTLQTNIDLSLFLTGGGIGGNAGGLFDTAGFLDTNDIFRGGKAFNPPLILNNSTSDYIRVTIRDNLTNINIFRMIVNKYRIL